MDSRSRPSHDVRILLGALAAALPAVVVTMWLLWGEPHSLRLRLTLSLLVLGAWIVGAVLVREGVVRPHQTLANLLGALREGDFSIRARDASVDDPLGLVFAEVNALTETLHDQRLSALEATALLRRVVEEIDVAVFTFDGDRRLRLVNRAGERLLGQPAERLLGREAAELGLADTLAGEPRRTLDAVFPGGMGRFEVRRGSFREHGLPHQLVVLTDLSRTLRAEERQAWQRLVRVLGHEINNSLAPIKSIAGSLQALVARNPRPADWEQDVRRGLGVIEGRSEALSRFMAAYARLARLPAPNLQPLDVEAWIRRVAALDTRIPVLVRGGPAVTIQADGDQLDQLLINLVRNAVDASLETNGSVRVGWSASPTAVEVVVEDDGPGLPEPGNLFVPFFTTKPDGSGIGLALCRQIAEAHGGSVSLEPRRDGRGAVARVRLPREPG